MSNILHIDVRLAELLRELLGSDGERLPAPALRWEMPKDAGLGDLSNASPFRLAAARRQPPASIAGELAGALSARARDTDIGPWLDRIEPAHGYINVFLSQAALTQVVRDILRQGRRYGCVSRAASPAVDIEFVSANPTGPLSVAHGRQAAVGDVLARLLRSQGVRVTREYYINDEGRQIEMLGRSLLARCRELLGQPAPFPEDGYHGAYVVELARRCVQEFGRAWIERPEAAVLPRLTRLAKREMLSRIRADLERFGLRFERWSSQRWIRTSGRLKEALAALREQEALYEQDGAMWFASSRYGDDKDRVVRKTDGELTYLAPDIAYHRWKFARGYGSIVNLWGPDHHGYIARLKAAVSALGLPVERLDVRIVQLVTLSRGGKPVPMSKRQGEFVTFREVLDEVGVDATRFFFLMRTMDSHLDFDLDLAKSQSQDNPVYYVQYAHARISSILAKAPAGARRPPLERLEEPETRQLIRALFQYPVVLRLCASALEPHGVTVYLRRLAEHFHVFYTKHRVISDDAGLTAARLALVRAARQVLANGLGILGVNAPERM
ncbi:MAG TPA: arginine--tRNA ligase [bacterium]